MDLLIATTAVVDGAPIVTRNSRDFARVPGVEVLTDPLANASTVIGIAGNGGAR